MQFLKKNTQEEKWFNTDEGFNELYPPSIRLLARRHWTPLSIARKAARFLSAENNARILDIGSGVGKFCLAAACYYPNAFYHGVEQRKSLTGHAETARGILGLRNVSFMHGNFTQVDFRDYDHFYFYNSFFENISGEDEIDQDIDYSGELYNYYNRYLYKQLEQKPAGTRLVTFHSLDDEIPKDFFLERSEMNNLLKYWIKE
jgi:Methyltransferase domain